MKLSVGAGVTPGAIGTASYDLTNLSATTCTLSGYLTVKLLNNGNLVGGALPHLQPVTPTPPLVTLAPGGVAHFLLVRQASCVSTPTSGPIACPTDVATTTDIDVSLPGEVAPGGTGGLELPFTAGVSGATTTSIGPVEAGS